MGSDVIGFMSGTKRVGFSSWVSGFEVQKYEKSGSGLISVPFLGFGSGTKKISLVFGVSGFRVPDYITTFGSSTNLFMQRIKLLI